MEKYTMVKTEVQDNGDIFVFYMDENATEEDGGVVTIDQDQLEQLQEDYVFEEVPVEHDVTHINSKEEALPEDIGGTWDSEDLSKLLIFFIDNKAAFQSDSANRKHLWTVACKTILSSKTPTVCENKLLLLKHKYVSVYTSYIKHNIEPKSWTHYDLCHQAFYDDSYVQSLLNESKVVQVQVAQAPPVQDIPPQGLLKKQKAPDESMKTVLNLYLQYKKNAGRSYDWQKNVWEKIAIQVGDDANYWHKRFLNFKQHYIKLLEQRGQTSRGNRQNITWPYLEIFDEIFKDDEDFKNKYNKSRPLVNTTTSMPSKVEAVDWDGTEKTVLVKYCFDCFDEFQDVTIPKAFLWNEVGRLLDKTADSCSQKYEELKTTHLNSYIAGGYNIKTRKPIAILFDNIISKEMEANLSKYLYQEGIVVNVEWQTEKFDMLAQFFLDNIELFKDPICHFVCWAAVARTMEESVETCREQWKQLTTLYKSILDEKKEDSELQIDWRYIDIFDRIFDYGMDINLLEGYEKPVQNTQNTPKKSEETLNFLSDSEEFDEKTSGKRSRGTEDPKAVKILEYYFKNKDRFATTQRKKHSLWEVLAKDLGVTAEQCAHRLRNLKQIYAEYIQREIAKPDKPVLWPYYSLCKKVFGYRAIKNKLKKENREPDDNEEWVPREIKAIITYFKQNLYTPGNDYNDNSDGDDASAWADLAVQIGKSPQACRNKFLDLRKSYRKIKTMMKRNPDCKVNWKYYKFFEDAYASQGSMAVDAEEETAHTNLNLPLNAIKTDITGDDDFQCIIVIPEGEEMDISNLNNGNAQFVSEAKVQTQTKVAEENSTVSGTTNRTLWKNKDKKQLLTEIYSQVKANEGKLINSKEMWTEISQKIDRTTYGCKRMWTKMKNNYKKLRDENKLAAIEKSTIYSFVKTILALKPKFVQSPLQYNNVELKEQSVYRDVVIPEWKVEKALQYYLDHVEEFNNPKYVKKYAWIDLAKHCGAPLVKIFKKINYLKQSFNKDTGEVDGMKVSYADLLLELLHKEFICVSLSKINAKNIPEVSDSVQSETTWSDDEIEQLLQWYLNNLEKFKNPKYVPSYLWMEASEDLKKGPLACSKKMTEIRSQYSCMVKESPEALNDWRFYKLCQKIYGTGKKNLVNDE